MSYLGRSAKLSRKTQEKTSFLATAGQTSKTGLSYVATFVEVTVNGILLTDVTDYTATSGSSITFTVALELNDEVTVVALKTFALADHYNKTESDAAFEPIDSAYTKAEGDARYEPIDSAYTKAEADANLAALVDSAPAALDTLNELAAALGDDVNFSTTVNNSIALKAPIASPSFTGGIAVTGAISSTSNITATTGQIALTNGYGLQWGGTAIYRESATDRIRFDVAGVSNLALFSSTGINITGGINATGARSFFTAGSENFAVGVKYVSGGGALYFGADSSSATPNGGIYNSGGAQIIGFNNDRSVVVPAGNVGIGTSSPAAPLHVNNAGSSACRFYLQNTGNTAAGYTQIWSQNNDLAFNAGNTERMRIDSSGNVGIGATPSASTTDARTLRIGHTLNLASMGGNGNANSYEALSYNAYKTGGDTWKAVKASGSNDFRPSQYAQVYGRHFFRRAAANATVDGVITWTNVLETTATNDVKVATGNLVIGTAGKGIDFSADGNYANTTSELLEDYEEGAWTPTFVASGGTAPSSQTPVGRYTKIGDVVHITGQVVWSGAGSGGSTLRILLPFVGLSNARGGIAIGLQSGISHSAHHQLYLTVEQGSAIMYLIEAEANIPAHTHLTFNNVPSAGSRIFSFSGCYHTTA